MHTTRTAIRRVALIGNPNTGKTTLFNALTGLSQRVGNYAGVTVERKSGRLTSGAEIVDLPGTYSLAPKSPDEFVVLQALLGEIPDEPIPDALVLIVDASHLSRNLYLVTQALELGIPAVLALNMTDVAEKTGVRIDVAGLARELGIPVVPIIASRGEGLDRLQQAIEALEGEPSSPISTKVPEFHAALDPASSRVAARFGVHDFLVRRALVDDGGSVEANLASRHGREFADAIAQERRELTHEGRSLAWREAQARYGWIHRVAGNLVTREPRKKSATDRIDAVITHRVTGLAIFVAIMSLVFMTIFRYAAPLMDLIDGGFGALGDAVIGAFAGSALAGGLLESLIVEGIIAGVGGVLIFLPQIMLLFVFIAILEDCGYMARAAFLMDRLLRTCGLSGHSFIPMLSSFACAIPGILAARSIRSSSDRLVTILVAPLMSCSARIPVYAIMIAAFIPASTTLGFLPMSGLVFAGMYFLGIAVAIPVAWILRRTIARGESSSFVMELPPYRMPRPRGVALRVWHAARSFVVRAGTVIFAMSILIWAAGTFPRSAEVRDRAEAERVQAEQALEGAGLEQELAAIDRRAATAQLESSVLGRIGHAIEPAVEPLGWDWKVGTAAVAAFPAREVLVSTLNILYELEDDEEDGLIDRLRGETFDDGSKRFGIPTALSIMVFIALCAQCAATLAVMARETASWRWPIFAFVYMTTLAWVAAFATYHLATLVGL